MKAEHLDEQPSITNTDDKVLSKLSQHWLKIIEGIADAKGGQEALDQYFTNKIKEAELSPQATH
jgi:transposase